MFIFYSACLVAIGFLFMTLIAVKQMELRWQYAGIYPVTIGYFSIVALAKA
jgi:hypothetical protein